MWTVKTFLCFLIVSVVKTSEQNHGAKCKNNYRDPNNNQTDVFEYCSNKICVEKCCRQDEIMFGPKRCLNNENKLFTEKNFAILKSKVNYSNYILSSRYRNKNPKKNIGLIHNQRDVFSCTCERDIVEYEILEDGSLSMKSATTKKWSTIDRLTFCIDYKLYYKDKNDRKNKKPSIKIIIREIIADPLDKEKIAIFETVGVSISSFFLLLVLIVYCLLPELRNLTGLVLMAYTFTLFSAFITKLVINFTVRHPPPGFCKRTSPFAYFFFMSSIFWLSVISFDVWSALRSFRIKRGSKGKDLTRFLWYALYAWGTPLLVTAIVTTLDNIETSGIDKPPFSDCFHPGRPYDYYFRIPIGILIIINVLLFIATVYNICSVKNGVKNSNSHQKRNTKYLKLSVMMGVNWCMELVETANILWLYILVNIYNIFIGVAVFYLFVWDVKKLALLCKKFNIQNEFTKNLDAESSQRAKSINTRTTFLSRSTIKSKTKDQNQDFDVPENFPKTEIPSV